MSNESFSQSGNSQVSALPVCCYPFSNGFPRLKMALLYTRLAFSSLYFKKSSSFLIMIAFDFALNLSKFSGRPLNAPLAAGGSSSSSSRTELDLFDFLSFDEVCEVKSNSPGFSISGLRSPGL